MARSANFFRRKAALVLLLFCAACSTTLEQRSTAAQQLNAVWMAENQVTRGKLATRVIAATADQTYRALKATLPNIGLEVDDQASSPLSIVAKSHYAQGGFSWSPAIRAQEEARMRQVFVDAIGRQGANLTLAPESEIITATGRVSGNTATTSRLSIDFRSTSPSGGCPTPPCVDEIPPSALSAAYYQFWTAFEPELGAIQRVDSVKAAATGRAKRRTTPAAPRKPPAVARAPSDWVLPPSGWKPPQ